MTSFSHVCQTKSPTSFGISLTNRRMCIEHSMSNAALEAKLDDATSDNPIVSNSTKSVRIACDFNCFQCISGSVVACNSWSRLARWEWCFRIRRPRSPNRWSISFRLLATAIGWTWLVEEKCLLQILKIVCIDVFYECSSKRNFNKFPFIGNMIVFELE